MGDGHLDHNILKLMLFCLHVCVNKIVENSERKIVNNKLLKNYFGKCVDNDESGM